MKYIFSLALLLALPMTLLAWTGPPSPPPACPTSSGVAGCFPPLNPSGDTQEKLGRLDVLTAGSLLKPAATDAQPWPFGLKSPGRISAGGLCFNNRGTADDCRYNWSEIGGGGGNCTISGNTITCGTSTFSNFWEQASGYIRNIGNGMVKIGDTTKSDVVKLEVPGGPINASGGFILENRTDNPSTLTPGRMWLCQTAAQCPTTP